MKAKKQKEDKELERKKQLALLVIERCRMHFNL